MSSTLSQTLLKHNFFSALGTTERIVDRPQIVRRGKPFTYDSRNGTTVIYDEDGRPWIALNDVDLASLLADFREFPLASGAYVPHASDEGFFIREVLQTLTA